MNPSPKNQTNKGKNPKKPQISTENWENENGKEVIKEIVQWSFSKDRDVSFDLSHFPNPQSSDSNWPIEILGCSWKWDASWVSIVRERK